MRLDDRLTHGHHRRVMLEPALERLAEDVAQGRAGEPRVKGRDHGKPQVSGGIRCHQSERRVESPMNVNELDVLAPEQVSEAAPKTEPGGDARKRAGAVDRAA